MTIAEVVTLIIELHGSTTLLHLITHINDGLCPGEESGSICPQFH